MSLRIEQGFRYQGDDRWKWWVWIDGPETELDGVEKVVYTLHPTFPNPVRTVTDRRSKFRLEAVGWGVFRIHAQAHFRNGSRKALHHDLELLYDDGTPNLA